MLYDKVLVVVQNYPAIFRFPLCVCLLSAGLGLTWARDLSLQGSSANAQDGFSILYSPSAEPISALQFDLEYDNPAVKLYPVAGSATRDSNKTLVVQDLSPTRKRFVIYGLNNTDISAGSLTDVAVNWKAPAGNLKFQVLEAKAVFGNGAAADIGVQSSGLTLSANTPQPLSPLGVWNAASGQAAPVSGGTVMTLRGVDIGPATGLVPSNGSVAASLGGYSVTFDGLTAPLLYAGPDQINLIAPWAITNRAATQITIARDNAPIAGVSAAVSNATPAIFTLSAVGTGGGAVINQDGTTNTPLSPAGRGTVIAIYGTGLGPLAPVGTDGSIAGVAYANLPVTVSIGGIPAQVLYAGSAPSLVSGVTQVNARIPDQVTPGQAVEIRITAGTAQGASGVTIAVQ